MMMAATGESKKNRAMVTKTAATTVMTLQVSPQPD
jgi:hypothetical protein